jgi:hypothetical protein
LKICGFKKVPERKSDYFEKVPERWGGGYW